MGPDALGDAYALIGFIGTALGIVGAIVYAIYRAAGWLRDRTSELFDSHQEALVAEVKDLKGDVADARTEIKDLGLAVRSVEVVQNQHAERLAWLEGQAGQPLGSLSRERAHTI